MGDGRSHYRSKIKLIFMKNNNCVQLNLPGGRYKISHHKPLKVAVCTQALHARHRSQPCVARALHEYKMLRYKVCCFVNT